ncbi:MAG: flagellar basal body rod protein FlgC [Planctomycetota bacterium]|nr:flagellar basal body rod protein FlgC [Planctomycetota bacterium]MDA1162076.1 flagellar basal body rod protein FlgC [Planctomycetota bacterium]
MLRTLDISRSALVAQRERMNVIAGNIANANTTRNAKGEIEPFQRRYVDFFSESSHGKGEGEVGFQVHIDKTSEPRLVHDPGHPDADPETGLVRLPNINIMNEFADAVLASRAYEANTSAIQMSRQMAEQTLRLLQ